MCKTGTNCAGGMIHTKNNFSFGGSSISFANLVAQGYGGGVCIFGEENYTMELQPFTWDFYNVTAEKGVSNYNNLFLIDSKFD